jgi:hypothetical protein
MLSYWLMAIHLLYQINIKMKGKEGGKRSEKVIFESLNFVIHWELGEPKSPSACPSTPSQRKKLLDPS